MTLPSLPFKTPSSSCCNLFCGVLLGRRCLRIASALGVSPRHPLPPAHVVCRPGDYQDGSSGTLPGLQELLCAKRGPLGRGLQISPGGTSSVEPSPIFWLRTRMSSTVLAQHTIPFICMCCCWWSCMMSKGSSLGTELRLWVHGDRPFKLSAWGTSTHWPGLEILWPAVFPAAHSPRHAGRGTHRLRPPSVLFSLPPADPEPLFMTAAFLTTSHLHTQASALQTWSSPVLRGGGG